MGALTPTGAAAGWLAEAFDALPLVVGADGELAANAASPGADTNSVDGGTSDDAAAAEDVGVVGGALAGVGGGAAMEAAGFITSGANAGVAIVSSWLISFSSVISTRCSALIFLLSSVASVADTPLGLCGVISAVAELMVSHPLHLLHTSCAEGVSTQCKAAMVRCINGYPRDRLLNRMYGRASTSATS
jgi:hypothetical protein